MSGFANFCFCSANSISALPLLKRGSSAVRSLSLSRVCVHLDFYHSSCSLQLKPNCRIIFEEAVISFVYFFEYFLRKFELFFCCVYVLLCVSRSFFFPELTLEVQDLARIDHGDSRSAAED
jgi:hypothetical protein